MPFVELKSSPHAEDVSPVSIHYRDFGSGPPIVFLHGGWGYGAYPIDHQIKALSGHARFLIPDRSGHASSTLFAGPLALDFHRRAAEETLLVLDALGIERAIFWGHSDGAVIAAKIGLLAPGRCERLLLEAFHFYRRKPASYEVFFRRFADHPEEIGGKLRALLAADQGEGNWQHVVQRNCRVWLEFAAHANPPDQDLYDGHLSQLRVPVTFMHGRGDPRTEPGEIERAHDAVSGSDLRFIESGRHSPHSEEAAWRECTEILGELLAQE
jgi:pimeloyl-ACP methyl ester carboxylesterase